MVYGILRAGTWGFVNPKPGAPEWLGLSPVIWLVLAGGLVLMLFFGWERRRIASGQAALVDPAMLRIPQLRGGLTAFFFQYLLQAGVFFTIPLFLSVALGLSAIETGVRVLPLSITLLIAAVGVPRVFPDASPRRIVRFGFLMLFAGIVVLVAALDAGAGPEIVTWPMLLAGLGIGALASQLGSVTVSSVPDEQSGEVGGLQNTVTNLGASIGTALAGAVLISVLTSSFLTGIESNPDVPEDLSSQAQVELAGGVPFISDADLEKALSDAGVPSDTAQAIVDENADARIAGLQSALAVLAVIALFALFFGRAIPSTQPGTESRAEEAACARARSLMVLRGAPSTIRAALPHRRNRHRVREQVRHLPHPARSGHQPATASDLTPVTAPPTDLLAAKLHDRHHGDPQSHSGRFQHRSRAFEHQHSGVERGRSPLDAGVFTLKVDACDGDVGLTECATSFFHFDGELLRGSVRSSPVLTRRRLPYRAARCRSRRRRRRRKKGEGKRASKRSGKRSTTRGARMRSPDWRSVHSSSSAWSPRTWPRSGSKAASGRVVRPGRRRPGYGLTTSTT